MHSEMLDHGLSAPEYVFRDGYFTVVLRGTGDDTDRLRVPTDAAASVSAEERLTKRQRQMAQVLAAGKPLTSRECQKRYGISRVVVARDFHALLDAGIAERVGKGRGTRYVFRGRIVNQSLTGILESLTPLCLARFVILPCTICH